MSNPFPCAQFSKFPSLAVAMASVYAKGTRVWLPDSTAGWIPGTVIAVVSPADKEPSSVVTISVAVDGASPDHAGAIKDIKCTLAALQAASEPNSSALSTSPANSTQDVPPPLRNPPLLESSEDLASLSNLNEPSGTLSPHLTRSCSRRSATCDRDPLRGPSTVHLFGHCPRESAS